MDDKGFLARVLQDVSVGRRNTIHLIKRICRNEDFMHTGFLQRNVTVFLQNRGIIKFNFHYFFWIEGILNCEFKCAIKGDTYDKLPHPIKENR